VEWEIEERAVGAALNEERGAGPAAEVVLSDNPARRETGICGFVPRRGWIEDAPFSA
jgi:hypothetical protein